MLNDFLKPTDLDQVLENVSNNVWNYWTVMLLLMIIYRICKRKIMNYLLKHSDHIQLVCMLIYLKEPLPFMIETFL